MARVEIIYLIRSTSNELYPLLPTTCHTLFLLARQVYVLVLEYRVGGALRSILN